MNSKLGKSVSIDGNRALIGAPGMASNGAVYVMDFDGVIWTRTAIIQATNVYYGFGSSVSLSGNRALITSNGGFCGAGACESAAFIFDFDGYEWIQTQKIITSNALIDLGSSVSISGDKLLIGFPMQNSPGFARVYELNEGVWVRTHTLRGQGTPGDRFGASVSFSGNRALVGAYFDNNPIGRSGSAYVFDFNGSEWDLTQKIKDATGSIGDSFGISVSLHNNRALIGANRNKDSGSAFIFEFDGNIWINKHKLLPIGGPSSSSFGYSVSLSSSRAIVGTKSSSGSVYVYEFNGNTWHQSQKIASSGGYFGYSINIFEDKILIGAYNEQGSGSAYHFSLINTVWTEQQKIISEESAQFGSFGTSISIFGDRALVGAYHDDENGTDSGSAYIFDFDGDSWSLTQKITSIDIQAGDNFGFSVSLSENRALIGSPENDDNGSETGSAYIFNYDGSKWTQTQKISAENEDAGDYFGISVSLFEDRALVGANVDFNNGNRTGSVSVIEFDGNQWHNTAKLIATDGEDKDQFGRVVSLSNSRALVGAPYDDDNGYNSGSAYVFEFNGFNWEQKQKLTVVGGQPGSDYFGASVSLYGDRALVGAPSTYSGSAYVFDFNSILWTQSHKIIAPSNSFGNSVSLVGDTALIGTIWDSRPGPAYLFDFNEFGWNQTQKIYTANIQSPDVFDSSVCLSNNHVLIGVPHDNERGTTSGSVFAYILIDDVTFENGFE